MNKENEGAPIKSKEWILAKKERRKKQNCTQLQRWFLVAGAGKVTVSLNVPPGILSEVFLGWPQLVWVRPFPFDWKLISSVRAERESSILLAVSKELVPLVVDCAKLWWIRSFWSDGVHTAKLQVNPLKSGQPDTQIRCFFWISYTQVIDRMVHRIPNKLLRSEHRKRWANIKHACKPSKALKLVGRSFVDSTEDHKEGHFTDTWNKKQMLCHW